MSYLIDLECPQCHQVFSVEKEQTFCHKCHTPILARYDLANLRRHLDRDELQLRPLGMWHWREMLPVNDLSYISSLGEGDTPLLPFARLGKMLGVLKLWAKDESVNPTASFKARGLSAAVSKAKEVGFQKLVIPTADNAGGALAAYASRARKKSTAVMPGDTPKAIVNECQIYCANVV